MYTDDNVNTAETPTGTLMVCTREMFHRVQELIHERHMEELEMSRYQLITDTYARVKP